jgi:hypothetical protein
MESFYFGIKKWLHLVVDDGLKKKKNPVHQVLWWIVSLFLRNFVELSYFMDFVVGLKFELAI